MEKPEFTLEELLKIEPLIINEYHEANKQWNAIKDLLPDDINHIGGLFFMSPSKLKQYEKIREASKNLIDIRTLIVNYELWSECPYFKKSRKNQRILELLKEDK